MAKQSYGIKTPMLASQLDQEITLQKDGVGLRPLPIKFVIITIISLCAMLYVFTSDLVSVGTGLQKVLFVCLWMTMTVLLFFSSKTQLLNVRVLFSFLSYLSIPGNRRLRTRKMDEDAVHNMIDMTNIKGITDDGMIYFADKYVGRMYRITGNASALLFESDRDKILARVDNFYRKINADVEVIFMTLKEPQRVYHQAAAIKRRWKALDGEVRGDKDMLALANNQITVLRDTVGKQLQSVHQYMLIKAASEDELAALKTDLQVELNQSTMFIRKCVPLDSEAIADELSVIYASPKLGSELDAIKNF
jgi:hypothetical protein